MATLPQDLPPARIAEIGDDVRGCDAVREVLGIFEAGATNSVVKTFAQHPALATPFLTFNSYLLRGSSVTVRLRQIAIPPVALTKKAHSMWDSHLSRKSVASGRGVSESIYCSGQRNNK